MKKENQSNEITLKELIGKAKGLYAYLILQKKIIIIAAAIGAFVGLGYAFIKKPVYTATLTFATEDEKGGGLGGALGLAGAFGLDLGGSGGGAFSGTNLVELFKSRAMVEQTLLTPVVHKGKQISLAEMFIQNNNWRDKWEDEPKLKGMQFLPNANRKFFTRAQDSIFGVIYERLCMDGLSVAQKDKKIAITTVDIVSKNELFAKYFCESLARQVGVFYVTTKSKKARMNMEILQRQTDSVRGELNGAITGVAIATDQAFNLNPAMNVRRAPSSRRQVDVQANTAILTELVKQSELAKVALRKETPLIQVIDRPILPLKKDKLGKAKAILVGGFLAGFLSVIFLMVRRIIKRIL